MGLLAAGSVNFAQRLVEGLKAHAGRSEAFVEEELLERLLDPTGS